MKKIFSIPFFAILVSMHLNAQMNESNLYMPLEYQPSYENGIRKMDGSVSSSYWQNHSDYKIKAKIDPKKKLLSGTADIVYYNESPDSLTSIVIQAYPDYYKPGAVKAGFFGATYDPKLVSDGMVFEKIIINGTVVNLKDYYQAQYNGTNYEIYLNEKLNPKKSLSIQVKWHYTIPGEGFERSGAIDPTSMFIAYWYPEIAVYDDINGWDNILYDASAEFYHDNSNYEVEIEVPKNYLVWSSVALSNPNDIYTDKILQNIEKAKTSAESVSIVAEADLKKLKLKSNIWKFSAKNIPDFAFALSNHFIWDAASYTDTYGTYFLNAVYDPKHPSFSSVVKTEQEAIKIFHTQFPKYEFPYHHFTIFNGLQGGGMEFPGMANDQDISGKDYEQWTGIPTTDVEANQGLSLHEMCHMYFPFLMGINEKRFAWMDEGMASFSEYFNGGESKWDYGQRELGYQSITPIMTPTYTQPDASSTNSYTIGSMSYYSLYHLLGETLFSKCLKAYMDRWNHKHPTPYDFMYTFNDVSGINLDWFWKNWYFDWGYMDVAIVEYKNGKLKIENKGRKAMAFTIVYTYADNTEFTETISPVIWKLSSTYLHPVTTSKEIKSIKLRTLTGSDAVMENNYWPGK